METNLRIGDEAKASKIRILNSNTELIVPNSSTTPVSNPEPTNILDFPDTIQVYNISQVMTQDKV